EHPAPRERASAAPKRVLADRVEDEVVRLAVLREVLPQVVDDLVRAERAHELDVLRVAHGGDVRAEVPGELHRRGTHRARRAVDEEAPPAQAVRLTQARQGDARA